MRIFDNVKNNISDYTLSDVFGSKSEEAMFLYENYTDDDIVIKKIEDNANVSYSGDFYGLLSYIGVDSSLHYIMLLLNRYKSPYDYMGEEYIKLIDPTKLRGDLEDYISASKPDTIATLA
jgi:CRISPR/Cas system-associated endonuclease/helicase Cas3